MGKYAWIITKDHLYKDGDAPNGTLGSLDKSAQGTLGPSNPLTESGHKITTNGEHFRMLDDNRELYYEGFIIGDYDGFEPLDDFGTPDSGCTIIQYKGHGTWSDL